MVYTHILIHTRKVVWEKQQQRDDVFIDPSFFYRPCTEGNACIISKFSICVPAVARDKIKTAYCLQCSNWGIHLSPFCLIRKETAVFVVRSEWVCVCHRVCVCACVCVCARACGRGRGKGRPRERGNLKWKRVCTQFIHHAVSDSFICRLAFTLCNDPPHVFSNLTFEGSPSCSNWLRLSCFACPQLRIDLEKEKKKKKVSMISFWPVYCPWQQNVYHCLA